MSISLDKLIKVLNLSTSNSDGEALNCIRAANYMVSKAGETWEKLLTGISSEKKQEERFYKYEQKKPKKPPVEDAEIEEMLEVCLEKVTGNGLDFIESLHAQWEERGTLSEKQIIALRRFYGNCR